ALHRAKDFRIGSQGNQAHTRGVRSIAINEFLLLARTRRYHTVNITYNLFLYGNALLRTGIGAALMKPLRYTKCVKELCGGNAQTLLQFGSHPTGHPEIAMDQIIVNLITLHKTQAGIAK